MDKILTVKDVAAVLQVKPITVREMFREDRLRGFKVGKSWRTTETMLQEDIAALAEGRSPATLPKPQAQKAEKPGKAPAPAKPAAKAKAARPAPADEPAPKPAAKAKPKKEKAAEEPDDSQQLLF